MINLTFIVEQMLAWWMRVIIDKYQHAESYEWLVKSISSTSRNVCRLRCPPWWHRIILFLFREWRSVCVWNFVCFWSSPSTCSGVVSAPVRLHRSPRTNTRSNFLPTQLISGGQWTMLKQRLLSNFMWKPSAGSAWVSVRVNRRQTSLVWTNDIFV